MDQNTETGKARIENEIKTLDTELSQLKVKKKSAFNSWPQYPEDEK